MYELSHLTDKAELDDAEADALVPYDVEELSSKLVAIDTGNGEAKALLEMVVALDRTHSERTVFLQHRLARAYRMCQLLREELAQAHERFVHVQEQVRHAAAARGGDAALLALIAQLEGAVDAPLAIEDGVSAERAALAREREELAAQRRDLEIRLAMGGEQKAQLPSEERVAAEKRIAAEVEERVAQIEKRVAAEVEERISAGVEERFAAEIEERISAGAEAADAPLAEAVADARAARAVQAETAAQAEAAAAVHADERMRWSVREMELVEEKAGLEAQVRMLQDTVRTTSAAHTRQVAELERVLLDTEAALDARHDAGAGLAAEVRRLRTRIGALEHDVSSRGIEIVRLEKAHARLAKENLHYSLALSAKQQELELIKRGTENAGAYLRAVRARPLRERANGARVERAHAAASAEPPKAAFPRAPRPASPGSSTILSSDLQSEPA